MLQSSHAPLLLAVIIVQLISSGVVFHTMRHALTAAQSRTDKYAATILRIANETHAARMMAQTREDATLIEPTPEHPLTRKTQIGLDGRG